jgi:hypothetical protein
MIPKLCAVWLVVLIVLPFTAPFSTCDLASLLDSAAYHGVTLAAATAPAWALALTNAAPSLVPSSATRRERARLLAYSRVYMSAVAAPTIEAQRSPLEPAPSVDIQPAFAGILRL